MDYLRKCRGCGVEAHKVEDLENFTKAKSRQHGRKNFCKKCSAKQSAAWRKRNPDYYKNWGKPIFRRSYVTFKHN